MSTLRKWATPLTAGTFLIMGATGTLMFFHVESRLNMVVHEWAGWLMLAGVAAHVVLNWRPFTLYFKRPLAAGIMGAAVLALALSFIPTGNSGGHPGWMAVRALGDARVETVIELAGMDTETGLQRLADAGVAAQAGQTLDMVTAGEESREMDVLRILFQN